MTIGNSTITGNSASSTFAGGLYNASGSMTISEPAMSWVHSEA